MPTSSLISIPCPFLNFTTAIEELGNPGWNWMQFLEYSKKCEGFILPSEEVSLADHLMWDLEFHGYNGPIKTEFLAGQSRWDLTLRDTLNHVNVKTVEEPQYLKEANSWLNLNVLANAIVCKIITSDIKNENGNVVATGVEFLHHYKRHLVQVKREVLVCARAIQSPQILKLSGIGDPAVLEKIGVPVKTPLSGVGNNIQEHLICSMSYELKEPDHYLSLDSLHDIGT
ncbi:hypothetical protein EWM64_g7059 [Hericium alpestre]|uniref:Glucose-methanol-choline oxidoreductase N-terminal domain-containing protein n=1 Tax=Hericium alpestre TaxID=135208 RepID=A0A4Y9ZPX8_9AGAM|nr:hypothetical protein EWM64_g7059 [Hericium alpestre]